VRKTKHRIDFTVYLVRERTTKNAVRYVETGGPDDDTQAALKKLGTFYVAKSAFPGKNPRRLIVRVRRGKRSR
jgi:hypothetical protein